MLCIYGFDLTIKDKLSLNLPIRTLFHISEAVGEQQVRTVNNEIRLRPRPCWRGREEERVP